MSRALGPMPILIRKLALFCATDLLGTRRKPEAIGQTYFSPLRKQFQVNLTMIVTKQSPNKLQFFYFLLRRKNFQFTLFLQKHKRKQL